MTDHDLKELFATSAGTVYQCNRFNQYVLDFDGHLSIFKAVDFFYFKKEVENINLEEMLQSTSRSTDVAILMPHYTTTCFILTPSKVVRLKELLEGSAFTIQLNSMVYECLQVNLT
ncbi:MAG TPA: hypothetical protein VNI52_02645 [Sphingobacteriaceae bacterium]|nr:hypothetical protein [Sphingobacteriaceae bacterium]